MSEQDNSEFFDPVDEINNIISSSSRVALPSIYEKVEKLDVVGEGKALVASANAKALPTRRVGKFEMLEVLERSLSRTALNFANPGERAFTALRELSDFVNMATTGSQPKVANAHRDLLPVGHPLSTREHNFSQQEVAQFHAEWMSADPRIAEAFRPLVASAFIAPASSLEREYVIAKLEATSSTEVPRDVILGLTADGGDPYGGGNSFLARSTRAKAQRRDRKGRFAYMGGGARIWLGKQFSAKSTLFRFAGYNSQNDSFDLEGLPNTPYQGKVVSVPASKVEAIKAILPEIPGLKAPASKSVAKGIIVDPSSLELRDAPTGWTKVSSENGVDTFRSADGWIATRYPNSASAPDEPSITRVRGANVDKSIDPDLPVYHIAKGSNDGLVTDKPFAVTQSWGDTQALISRYDKKTDPKSKATLEEQPEEFLEGWTKGVYQVVKSDNENPYIIAKEDTADGKTAFTDPSGRYVAIKLATVLDPNWGADAQGAKDVKDRGDSRTRSQVIDSGKPIETFDGAQKWDGKVDNLYRLERVKSDGRREVVGFYQDPEDIERDTEVPPVEDKSNEFYQNVIADTLQNGGNTIDFVDGSSPEDGYIIAHEPDVLRQDGTIGKREEIISPEDFADPIEGPKILRAFILKNQDKLNKQGFYLGTWLDTVDVTDENGKVIDKREKVFLDVSEYERDFDKAFDMSEARKEIAYYGVSEGKSFYVADEKRRREILRKTPKLDQAEKARLKQVFKDASSARSKWSYENMDERERLGFKGLFMRRPDEKGYNIPNPKLEAENKEIYDLLMAEYKAQVAYGEYEADYLRSIFTMPSTDIMRGNRDPGGKEYGFAGDQDFLRIRNKYVSEDTTTVARNENLRNGGEPTREDLEMDFLIRQSKLKDDTAFYRGINLDPELVKELSPGDTYYSRAFSSMALDKEVALLYVNGRYENTPGQVKTVFRMLCPKGMNAVHVGGNEVVLPRNTKMRIIRKSEVDGITYFDVDVEPQTKEEIDARIQGRVPKPEESQDAPSSSELPANDGGGADGLGDGGPLQINYGPKSTVEGPVSERVGSPKQDIFERIVEETVPAERLPEEINDAASILKDNVAQSVSEKITGVSNDEFINLAIAQKDYRAENFNWQGKVDIEQTNLFVRQESNGLVRNYNYSIGEFVRILSVAPELDEKDKEFLKQSTRGNKVTYEDAQKILDLWNPYLKDKGMSIGTVLLGDKNNEDLMKLIRYRVTSNLVKNWAKTANGDNPVSLAIQDAAFKEFGIDRPAQWRVSDELKDQISEITDNHGNLFRRFLRAQYELTQEYFQKKGISKITLFRGVKDFTAHDMDKATFPTETGFTASIRLRPLSSWTTSVGIANGFRNIDNGKMFRKEYDAKDILGFPGTGIGCLQEEEFVVLGGITKNVDVSAEYKVEQLRVQFPSPEPAPITYKEDQPQVQINNAPLTDIVPDDGGDEPELDIFELEGVDVYRPEIYKAEVAQAIAESDEMAEVDDSQLVAMGAWLNITNIESINWSKPTKKLNEIELASKKYNGKLGDFEELSDVLYYITEDKGGEEDNWGYKKGGVAEKILKAYASGYDPEISKEELQQFIDEYNLVNQYDPNDSYFVPDTNNDYFMSLYREEVASTLVSVWATTSNGDHPISLAIQDIAKDLFGIQDAPDWKFNNQTTEGRKKSVADAVNKLKENQGDVLRAFVQAQYNATQEWFKERGIDKITVYRGIKDAKTTVAGEGLVGLRPLSSWSTNLSTAIDFTRGKADTPLAKSMVFRREVDVKEIFSTPLTGVGCMEEYEVVLLGGKKTVDSASPEDRSMRMGVWPKAPAEIPVANAPKPMSNTERKRLEREQRKAEEAAAPTPEEAKQQMDQAQQAIAQVAQVVPQKIDDLFDPNNPLNIVDARNITNDITGSTTDRDNLSREEILKQPVLFMEPTQAWEDLLDQIENAGSPFAKEIVSRLKNSQSRLIKNIEEFSTQEVDAQRKYEESIKDLYDSVGVIVNNGLANPDTVPGMNGRISRLMVDLDDYFLNGNQSKKSLVNNGTIESMAVQMIYGDYAATPDRLGNNDVRKAGADIISQLRAAYTRYPNPADRSTLVKEIQKIYIESSFGGVNPTNTNRSLSRLDRAIRTGAIPVEISRIISKKMDTLLKSSRELGNVKKESYNRKAKLAEKISEVTKQVLSENGVEFDHGVTVSSSDINWLGVGDMAGYSTNLTTGVTTPDLVAVPDGQKGSVAPELRNINGVVDVINKALQSYPKPVALLLKKFLIDHKTDMTFASGQRGFTGMLNLKKPYEIHDVDGLGLEVVKTMGLAGREEKDAVSTTVHEMLHLIVNGILRQEMNSVAWVKSSRETNNKDSNGKITHNFVDGNYGNVGYTMNGDYLSPDDVDLIVRANELGAASSKYAAPYIGKYGSSAAVDGIGLGQSPFSHGELLSTLVETLLGGGVGSMFSTWANPKRVMSGTNPDGTPKYVTMNTTSVFSEEMMPFGVSMVLLLNQLAKTKLGIA